MKLPTRINPTNILASLRMARIGFGLTFGKGSKAYPTDTIIPIDKFDNNTIFRTQFLRVVFRFDRVLSANKLRDALQRLIEEHGWTKLGARIHKRNGKLEFYIPSQFDAKRPSMRYDHQEFPDASISDYDIPDLPQKTDHPSIVCDPKTLGSFFSHLDVHTNIEDFLSQDTPAFGLSTVRFHDATLVCLSFPHILFDGVTVGALMKAWAQVLDGKDKDVPQAYAATDAPLQTLGTKAAVKHRLHDQRVPIIKIVFQWIYQNFGCFISGTEQRMVAIPPSFVKRLKALSENNNNPKEFVSEGDIVSAWWARLIAKQTMPWMAKTVTLYNVVAFHSLVRNELLDPTKVYIGNAVGYVATLLPAHGFLTRPLHTIASAFRRSVAESTERSQLEANVALFRKHADEFMPTFGGGFTYKMAFSNATKCRMLDNDFSAAVDEAASSNGNSSSRPFSACKPTLGHSFQDFYHPHFFTIFAKDADGNLWMTGNIMKKHWDAIERDWQEGRYGLDQE